MFGTRCLLVCLLGEVSCGDFRGVGRAKDPWAKC